MTHLDLLVATPAMLTAIMLALFIAGTTKGLLGVGMPIVAVPLLSLIVDLPIVVVLLSIPLIVTNIPQALVGEPVSIVLRRLVPIFAGLIVGVIGGIWLLSNLNPALMKPIVGAILIAIAFSLLFSPRFVVPPRLEIFASPIAGLIGGVAGGVAALPGPFVFAYLLALGIKRDQFVQYSSMFLTVAATLMTVTLGSNGLLNWNDALISTAATLPIFLGMWVGTHTRQWVSPDLFRKIILGVVLVSGLNLISYGMSVSSATSAQSAHGQAQVHRPRN